MRLVAPATENRTVALRRLIAWRSPRPAREPCEICASVYRDGCRMRCLRVKSKTTKTMSQTISANPASGIVNTAKKAPSAIGYSRPPKSRPRTTHGLTELSSSWQRKAEANSTSAAERRRTAAPRKVRFRGKQTIWTEPHVVKHMQLRPFGQARAGGWGGRGRSSCRATDAATKPEARAQTPISLSGDLTCAMISVVAGCALRCNDFNRRVTIPALSIR